jgi:predicted glycogen debranching enzyme
MKSMREWITSNGLGGYASLSYSNEVTRKFHGLLIASLKPPTKRWLFVSNIYDTIKIGNITYDLRTVGNTFHFDIVPTSTYSTKDFTLKKTFFMDYQKNTTLVKYEITNDKPASITHNVFINSRHFYDTTASQRVSFQQKRLKNGVCIQPDNVEKKLTIIVPVASYAPVNLWQEFSYTKDQERKDAFIDFNFHVGDFEIFNRGRKEYFFICTLENAQCIEPQSILTKERQRKKDLVGQAKLSHKYEKLIRSTDMFLVKKGEGKSIIAGYHWFSDWGRDTLISLPGITLVTKRFDEAKQILYGFGKYCRQGLIPNVFMDRDAQAVYNTVDASLWYIDRVYQFMKYTNDLTFLNELWGVLESIIKGYQNGTQYGIHMDKDFLISHGEGLTWMDVKLGDYYPTPRSKKAVEIQALWFNALKIMSVFAHRLGRDDIYASLAEKVKENFFLHYDQQYDVLDTKDISCRPNQLFLVSLDFTMIDKSLQEKIVSNVKKYLLTPFGLRSLSPCDSKYKGSYLGPYHKDLAYHNGTVWPWLIGPFITAFIKVNNATLSSRSYAFQNFLQPMFDVFGEQWDGSVYEIFDGDPPFLPRGCIAQAWSIAEILRCWVEDIEQIRAPYENVLLHEIGV